MNAIALIRQCKATGIQLQARGDRLHVEAPAGSLTPELRQALADHKAELMGLHATRKRLVGIAASLGIPRAVVDDLPLEELFATAKQVAQTDGHKDRNGDPLAHSLLTFYLRCLADQVSASPSTHGATP